MHSLFCITHQPQITIDLDPSATIVWLGAAGQAPQMGHQVLDVHQAYPDLMAWHPFLTGAAGTFAIRRFLNAQAQEFSDFDLITLTQYRKFISRQAFGRTTDSFPTMRFINQSTQVPNYAAWFTEPEQCFCIANPRNIGNTFQQYIHVHQAPDFLRYLAIAVEHGVITPDECFQLINHPTIIPGGIEVGTLPINIFLAIAEQLEVVCLQFLEHHRPVKLDAYHRRALAFCNERLGSYLLQKVLLEIFGPTIPSEVIGYMHTVDIGATEYRVGT
ncbi:MULTISPECIES: hypothetical protein [Giesbergeria]|uniref:Uncharacterized protein n=1 Tax=Giesbergeria sinuosa TaxID=80883 RepID=A0ABV9QEX9_9BURK